MIYEGRFEYIVLIVIEEFGYYKLLLFNIVNDVKPVIKLKQ